MTSKASHVLIATMISTAAVTMNLEFAKRCVPFGLEI